MVNIKCFDPNQIKINKKSYKNVFINFIKSIRNLLFPTDDSNYILEKCKKMWTKIKDLITSKTNNSDNYDKKFTKIKFNSEDDLEFRKP